MKTEQLEIRNRFTNAVQITATITCSPDTWLSLKLGLAVRWAVKADANLADANLAGANLAGANLAGANLAGASLAGAYLAGANLAGANLAGANLAGASLAGAYLAGANLAGANLAGANLADANLAGANLADAKNLTDQHLRFIKADMWMTLVRNPGEVAGLIEALKDGRVDGSQYTGECACLVGTIANIAGVDYSTIPHDASAPAERWFASIGEGDKPGDDSAGGFAATKALEWAEEFFAHCPPRVLEVAA
jgi:uncharacterized protein YjbI with pentapeptide repeats